MIQDTLDACTSENVAEMERAMGKIYRRQSQGYRHDYSHEYQLLEVDMSGRPCGKKAALSTKVFFNFENEPTWGKN